MVCTAALDAIGEATTDEACRKLMRADVLKYGNRGPYIAGTGYEYSASVEMARAAIKKLTVVPRTDNQALDPRYPTGVPPVSVPVIVVATPPGLTLTAGDTISQALASYVTGADASGYVMSLVAVSGTLAGVGGVLTTTTLSGTAVQGNFTYRLRVTKSGFTFDAPATTQIAVAAAVIADTLAPNTPKFFTIATDSVTPKVDLAGDYPMDQRSATVGPTDKVSVDIERATVTAGVIGAYSIVTTKTASLDQPNPILALYALGAATIGSASKSGADITLSNVVDGLIGNSNDDCNFYGGPITLPVGGRVGLTLPAFSSGYEWSVGGLMIRQSLTSKDKSLQILRRATATPEKGAPMLSRATLNAVLTYTNDATVTGEVDAVIERGASNTWIFSVYSGGNIVAVTTHTVAMTGPIYVGPYLSREAPGAAISAIFKNFWVSANARWTYSDTTVVAGQVYAYRIRGKDAVP